jgi:hypothetical protein
MVGLMILSAGWRVFQGWGRSSAGRAPALQAGGHRFDPDRLHHPRLSSNEAKRHRPLTAAIVCLQTMRAEAKSSQVLVCIADVRIRFDHVPGQSVLGCVVMPFAARLGGVVLCYIVNQVLVRLWARVIGISPSGLVEIPSFD